jgi:hypothetical protein
MFALGTMVLVLLIPGCDLLSNKPEIDVEKAIDEAVSIASERAGG